ncbi:MAG: hypothetical protein ACRELC_08355 [Gemmatimonadota bacterium]
MTLSALLVLLLIALVCGTVGQLLAGYSLGGLVVATAVGFVGAVLGMWLAAALGLPVFYTITVEGVAFPLVWCVMGSALLVTVLGAIAGGKRW